MSEAQLQVQIREGAGKQKAKTLRKEGQIPAIYYAHDQEAISLSVDGYTFERILQKEINIIDIVFPDGKTKKSIVRDLQKDPVTNELLHADFLGIKLDEEINMMIPVILKGVPVGVKLQDGILEHPMREAEVIGFPLDIPEHIEVDVSEMEIGDVLTLEKIPVGKFRFATELNHPVAIVVQAKAAKVTAEEGAEEGEIAEAEEVEGDESAES
ncbi:50S ribosomal protein L25 [bacterium]|nr:50S ribosomal protein L25 [bacterium]